MRTALVRDGQVVEITDAGLTFAPPEGMEAVQSEDANLGDTYKDGSFERGAAYNPLASGRLEPPPQPKAKG
jgi:hypothetical protein